MKKSGYRGIGKSGHWQKTGLDDGVKITPFRVPSISLKQLYDVARSEVARRLGLKVGAHG